MIIKSNQTIAVLVGVLLMTLSGFMFMRVALGLPSGLNLLIEPLGAVLLGGFAAYLFGIAIWRPIALRMDEDGISGYFAPPVAWDEVGDVEVFKEYSERGDLFPITYLGIKLRKSSAVYRRQSHRAGERMLRKARKTGYHFLIPQLLMKDCNADWAVTQARVFQDAAAKRSDNQRPA